jgi:hypothetical protein
MEYISFVSVFRAYPPKCVKKNTETSLYKALKKDSKILCPLTFLSKVFENFNRKTFRKFQFENSIARRLILNEQYGRNVFRASIRDLNDLNLEKFLIFTCHS